MINNYSITSKRINIVTPSLHNTSKRKIQIIDVEMNRN